MIHPTGDQAFVLRASNTQLNALQRFFDHRWALHAAQTMLTLFSLTLALASVFFSKYKRSRPPDASVADERPLTVAIAYMQVTPMSSA